MRRLSFAVVALGLMPSMSHGEARADAVLPNAPIWVGEVAKQLEAEGFEVRAYRREGNTYTIELLFDGHAERRSAIRMQREHRRR